MKSTPLALAALALLFSVNSRADQIRALTRGDHSLAAFYQAIASAQKTIDVATYEFEPCDAVTKVLMDAISKKAKSGVKVRIVLEGYYVKDPKRTQFANWAMQAGKPKPDAKESNIEVRKHGTSTLLAGDASRNHSKIFVVDGGQAGSTLITGGRNLTDQYFGLSSSLNYLDQDLLVRGGAATDGWKYFNELWQATTKVGDLQGPALGCMAMGGRDKAVESWVRQKSAGVLGARPVHSCAVDYAVDNPKFMDRGCGAEQGPDSDFLGTGECWANKRATGQVISFMHGTREKLLVANQYFYPWGRTREQFDRLRDRLKRTIEVYGNATAGLDDQPMHNAAFTCFIQSSGYQHFKGTQKVKLLTSKGALRDSWELTPGGANRWRIHTKSMIRDGRDVLVSSWNIDPRSYQTNLETAAVVASCPGLVADINQQYEQLKATHKADENCVPCKADFLKSNMSDSVFCGGTPTFY